VAGSQGDQIGRMANACLFTLGSYLKITELTHMFGLIYSRIPGYELILTKNVFGYTLADLFYKFIWSPCRQQQLQT
jgi:hypothetical protein